MLVIIQNEVMSGLTPKGGEPETFDDNTNAILLWNNEEEEMEFIVYNTLALNVINHR
jgi:hypothetical protein